ncbi:MAG TPA: hypothetical protein VK477_08290, partial [Acidobacteriota bacterium]|nr:hypothetical protein [Acidobacteriota bacterium]
MRPRLLFAVVLLATASVVRADEPATTVAPASAASAAPKPEKATDDDLRIRGIFNSALPGTEKKHSLRLIVHPHLGDLTKRDHLRTALGLRYGLTSRWEATAETDAYFTHGAKDGAFFEDSGLASIHLGTKYRLGDPLHLGIDTSIGLDWSRPLGTPPSDVTDGLKHISPFFTMSRPMKSHPGWRVFWGLSYDDVTETDVVGRLEKNDLRDDSLGFSAGVLWERGPTTYTLESTYHTTRLTSDSNRYVLGVRPGVVWTLPPKYTF